MPPPASPAPARKRILIETSPDPHSRSSHREIHSPPQPRPLEGTPRRPFKRLKQISTSIMVRSDSEGWLSLFLAMICSSLVGDL